MSEEIALENFLNTSWCEMCQYNYRFVFLPFLDQSTDPLAGRCCNMSMQSEEPLLESMNEEESQCGHRLCSFCQNEYTDRISLAHYQENSVEYKDIEVMKMKDTENHENENVREFFVCNEIQSNSLKAFKSIHNKKKLRSTICRKIISRWNLEEHEPIHTGENYKCSECEGRSPLICSLEFHKSSHTGEMPHKCDILENRLQRKAMWQRHMSIHTEEKLYRCDICEKAFARRHHLKQHIIGHTKIKPYKCNVCAETFSAKVTLKRHILSHTREKPHKCDICEKHFARKDNLKSYRISHSREKPYKCDICYKRFRFNRSLKNHVGIHTRELLHENAI